MKPKPPKNLVSYFSKNITAVIGIVLIWRGIWYLLDMLDQWLFGGGHWLSAFGSIVAGILILYLPDKNLNEIERL